MKRALIVLGGLAVLGGVLVASIRAGGGKKGVKVYVEPVARRAIQQVVKASGGISPRIKVNISAHVVAKIERIYVNEGDFIRKGQPFLTLEKWTFLADRDQWSAQLQSAQTAVQQAEVSLADSRIKLARAERLKKEGIATTEQLEAAQLAERSARLRLQESGQLVSQMRANLTRAETDLGKTTIYAPLSGRVIALNAKEGEVVVSGTMNNPASVIGTIADLSEVLAEVDVDETEIVHVKVGQRGTLKVDALPDRVYHGKVTEVGSSGYNRTQQPDVTFFKVKLLFDDSDERLRQSMSVRAEIQTQRDADALVVPIQSVVDRPPLAAAKPAPAASGASRASGASGASGASTPADGGKPAAKDEVKVVFVSAAGKVHQRQVSTGISDETHVEIASGLAPGEKVVTGPYRTLRELKDGAAVEEGKPGEEKAADTKATAGKDQEP
jgi:HlyD family secretion protein